MPLNLGYRDPCPPPPLAPPPFRVNEGEEEKEGDRKGGRGLVRGGKFHVFFSFLPPPVSLTHLKVLSGAGAGFCVVRERRRGFTRVDTIMKGGERVREGTRDTARQRRGFGEQRGTLRDDARRFVYSPSESQIDPFSSPLSPHRLHLCPPSHRPCIPCAPYRPVSGRSPCIRFLRCSDSSVHFSFFFFFLLPPPPSHSVT